VLILFLVASVLIWQGLPRRGVVLVVILVLVFVIIPAVRNNIRVFLMARDIQVQFLSAKRAIDHDEEVEVPLKEAKAEAETSGNSAEKEADVQPHFEKKASQGLIEHGPPKHDSNSVRPGYVASGKRTYTTSQRESKYDGVEESEAIYQVWEKSRIFEPTDSLCWFAFAVEFILLFLYPTISLYRLGNRAIGSLFFVATLFTGIRTYLNAAVVLEEVGNLNLVDGKPGSLLHWQNQSRLATIVRGITRSRGLGSTVAVLWVFLLAFLGLFSIAIHQPTASSSTFEFGYLPDFEYASEANLLYPTCSVAKGLAALGSPATSIADYAFLAVLAYRTPEITQGQLDQWFGPGVAFDNQTLVANYRNQTGTSDSPVNYKFFVFPTQKLGIVSIRGTITAWDALTDAQLWSAAFLFQALRFLLPMGETWNPLLHRMDTAISWLESETIDRVAFYRETTAFTEFVKSDPTYEDIQVTGHSLGGGLAIITGAQTSVDAVGLSGPNAMISRDTFSPPLSVDTLNSRTFNIIPDRDVVPRIDEPALLNQHIRCFAPVGDFIGCHDGRRSLCEILYSCGSGNRPALCECNTLFDYPEPAPKPGANRTFAEACPPVEDD